MNQPLQYDPSGCSVLDYQQQLADISDSLEHARTAVLQDVRLFNSGDAVPEPLQPLDAGFIEFPARLLEEADSDPDNSLVGRIERAAAALREQTERVLLLGIGGSYMGARALFEALCHPYHNEVDRDLRSGAPRIYFEGHNVDNEAIRGLLQLLESTCQDPSQLAQRWGLVVISKSGGTLETALSFRLFRDALETYYGAGSDRARELVIPITGEVGKLRSVAEATGYPVTFPIPDGIGGRFSVLTAVGLLPAAIMGIDIRELLRGAAEMTERFESASLGENPVLDYTGVSHVLETHHGCQIRILSTWGSRLEALGLWYDQLLSESLGKDERGATPITVLNTRDLHSRGQQHQEGRLDKLITNLSVGKPESEPLRLPASDRDQDQLNRLAGTAVPRVLEAAREGTNQAYREDGRPTADLILPELNAHTIGQTLQMLMLATVVEGRLIGINPYGQPGVEAYKRNMTAILDQQD